MAKLRGADVVVQTLARAGVTRVFSLSGNHIMPLYDAAIDAQLAITHTRHENAAVHMADAWGRLSHVPGVAWLTGGPGHANGIGALYTALASESPLVLMSGHAPLGELGKGSFQEMDQAAMAAPVTKASWVAKRVDSLGEDVARALRIARSGRPGPVHLSLPIDLLEAQTSSAPPTAGFEAAEQRLDDAAIESLLSALATAERPLVLCGAVMSPGRGDPVRAALAIALGIPAICMESPRGLNDPALGALASIVSKADAILLLGKQPDFTLRFGRPPAIAAECRIMVVDPDASALERARDVLGSDRVVFAAVADSVAAARHLSASGRRSQSQRWADEVAAALRMRPREWDAIASSENGPVHPVKLGRAVQSFIDSAGEVVLVSDGGEFGQWAQACIQAPTRIINGQGGSIGSAIPFALAAKAARPNATVVALTGDGACGFHLLEIETAVRAGLAFVAIVGNDACWNAEHQIQLRAYGKERALGCELAPSRYDEVARALGGYGELVTRPADLPAALERAAASRKPSIVNVMVERLAAPAMSRVS